jgi:UDP-glucuronate decarboxylase
MPKAGKSNAAKTVIVAGGAGFVGSHLCERLLQKGHRVVCIDNFLTGATRNIAALRDHLRFSLIDRDICRPLDVRGKIDQIYNLACAASPPRYQANPIHTMRTCVLGTLNLLELAERDGARFVQASTSEVYGDPEQHPQREDYWGNVNCTGPRACYDEGKRAAETLCFDFLREGRADVRVARIFNTYGPRMQRDDGRIVSNLIVQSLAGQPLTVYGDGSQTRSFCYVSDLVRGLVALMEAGRNPEIPINLGNPREFTINQLADLVVKATGSRSGISFLPLPEDDPRRRKPDISLAQRLLGWEPWVPLEEGLETTIRYFRHDAANRPARPATGGPVATESVVMNSDR